MREPARILICGCSGQLGWELRRSLSPLGVVIPVSGPVQPAPGATALNLCDTPRVRQLVREVGPDIVVNAAAFTDVERAELEPDLAMAVNAGAVRVLAEETERIGARLLHFSTDYVFDGNAMAPYVESDEPGPINAYGRSKLAGELAVQAVGGAHLVLRTSWLYASRGRNFLLTVLRAVRAGKELRIVDDQTGAPTSARSVAEMAAHILAQGRIAGDDWLDQRTGVYHVSAAGACSWYDFAGAIVDAVASQRVGEELARGGVATGESAPAPITPAPITRVTSEQYPTKAVRPKNSRLECSRAWRTFGLRLSPWREQLAQVIEETGELGSP